MTRAALLAAVLLAGTAAAQTWEQIPPAPNYGSTVVQINRIAFLPGPSAEGSLVIVGHHTMLYDPDRATEAHLYPWVSIGTHTDGVQFVTVTTAGTLLGGAASGTKTDRSTDRGQSWDRDVYSYVTDIYQTSLPALIGPEGHGAVFVSDGRSAVRSFGDGARGTWETLGVIGGEVVAFGEAPPSGALPQGRLLAAVFNGVTTSDDGGATWEPGRGAYGYAEFVGYGFAFVAEAGHPYGGALLAGVNDRAFDRDSSATVYRSEDGGATWARWHRFSPAALGLPSAGRVVLAATPDGAVWAGVSQSYGPAQWNEGAVARSLDGGRTWAPAGYVGATVNELEVGPEGRLYAATYDGVWRTTAPAYAVGGEPAPEPAALAVRAWPNPTVGRATVSVALAAPEAVRVSVFDAQGREVAVVHDGPARDGQRGSRSRRWSWHRDRTSCASRPPAGRRPRG